MTDKQSYLFAVILTTLFLVIVILVNKSMSKTNQLKDKLENYSKNKKTQNQNRTFKNYKFDSAKRVVFLHIQI